MRYIVIGMILIFALDACKRKKPNVFPDDAWIFQLKKLEKPFFEAEYRALKNRMKRFRMPLKKQMKGKGKSKWIDRSRSYLYTTLTDSLFQFWYNTEWDFNGTTENPGTGKIACGYFVTTTLAHAGFKLDRVRLAQQAASVIINSLCKKEHIQIFSNGKRDELKSHLLRQKNSLFILGLDSHVGFLQKQDTSIYMIHSSGFYPWKVVREPFHTCAAIQHSSFFMAGDVLRNDDLIQKWIMEEKIEMRQ